MAISFLWRSNTRQQLNKNHKKPSSKHCRNRKAQARGTKFYQVKRFPKPIQIRNAIKRISLFISGEKTVGSMTVEASIVLPLFLFFFLNLGCVIELIRLHSNLEMALFDVGRRIAIYGYALSENAAERETENSEAGWWSELKDVTISYTYIKGELTEYVGEQYLEEAPIRGGADGLQFLESEIFTAGDCVDIILTYEAEPFVQMTGFRPFRMANRYYAHLWNGYCIPESGQGEENPEETDFVYVAENGEVYHEDRNCSHLLLHVQSVSLAEAYESRNANGDRYMPCEVCAGNGFGEMVFIAEDGTAIHSVRSCPGLKRTVSAISRKEAGKYRPCRDCT